MPNLIGLNGNTVEPLADGSLLAIAQPEAVQRGQFKGELWEVNTTATAQTLTISTTEVIAMLYLSNDSSSKDVYLDKVIWGSDDSAVVNGYLLVGASLASVAANNSVTPLSLNQNKSNTPDVTVHSWDETGTTGITTISGGTKAFPVQVHNGSLELALDGRIVLGNGDTVLVYIHNPTGGDIEGTVSMTFYTKDS